MKKITEEQLVGLFSLMISKNKMGVISSLNSQGYRIAFNITEDDLLAKLIDIYKTNGAVVTKSLLSGVKIPVGSLNQEEIIKVYNSLNEKQISEIDFSQSRFSLDDFMALWSGQTVATGTTTTSTSKPALDPKVVVTLSIVAIVVVLIATFLILKK